MKKQVRQSILEGVARKVSKEENVSYKDALRMVVDDLDKYADGLFELEREDIKRHE